jgi:hypothetical protein
VPQCEALTCTASMEKEVGSASLAALLAMFGHQPRGTYPSNLSLQKP